MKATSRVLILTAEGFEESELLVPYYRLLEAGAAVDIAAPVAGIIHGKHGYPVEAGCSTEDTEPSAYCLLVIPGGKAPERLGNDAASRDIVKAFFATQEPVAAICHGPLLLARAGVLGGYRLTAHAGVAPALVAAGAQYEERAVVVDRNLITSRGPADLPHFMREVMATLASRCDVAAG